MTDPDAPVPPSTAVADVLALRGRRGWLTPPLRRLVPGGGTPALATARTVALRAGRGGLKPLYEVLSDDLHDRALVLSSPVHDAAVWGELLGTAAAQAGATAVLVDGAVRDIEACRALGMATWASAAATVGPAGGLEVASVGEPVEVGGVTVHEGDLLLGDADGVVAVPAGASDRVLTDATLYAAAEARVVDAVRTGVPLSEAYKLKAAAVTAILGAPDEP